MTLSIFVDGSGGPDAGFGFFVKETGESFYQKEPGITNNQAEYKAIIAALKKYLGTTEEIVIYSDSKNTVSQLNHEFAINNARLRELAMETWQLVGTHKGLQIKWIPRQENLAGKMLGS
ncbi:MAG: reverse transcriptase-like protein [Thaumarchaeota archaeon]|nr:reverse transcriptase-like protein [Nitrososphaerota archaeon]